MSSVFFSLISPDKGVDIALGAAKLLPEVDFHFYGRLESDYEDCFCSQVENLSNVHYHGVFDSVTGDVLGEINKYDVHIFPTLCPNEGVPGVIAETKLAGVPTIASDRSYNRELVRDGVDGVLTHEDTAGELARILGSLAAAPMNLDRMKEAALVSSERYDIERYLDIFECELLDYVGRN